MIRATILFGSLILTSVVQAEMRTWAVVRGTPVVGEYVSCENGVLMVKTVAAQQTTISIADLSESDQLYAAEKRGYAVVKADYRPGFKASLDVRLPVRVSKHRLSEIANELRAFRNNKEPRLFILYYLPGMKVDKGAWASTHFTLNLDVKVLGTTKEEHERLASVVKSAPPASMVGRWMASDALGFPGVITIFKEGSSFYKTQKFKDGSEGRNELVVQKVGNQVRYKEKARNTSDYMAVLPNGDLGHFDRDGMWTTSEKVP